MIGIDNLNTVLQGILNRLRGIGTVYIGTKLVTAIPSRTSTRVLKVVVPPGTYVVTACVEWGISTTDMTVMSLYAGSACKAVSRGNMSSGGGDVCSAVVTVEIDTALEVLSYQGNVSAVNLGFTSLTAVKIK